MRLKKLTVMALVSIMAATALPVAATVMGSSTQTEITSTSGDDEGTPKKDKKKDKKKEKKKKKEKEVKTPEEVLEMLKGIKWTKPAKSGLDVDSYYNDADEFFSLIKTVDEKVSLFKVCKVVDPNGNYIIAPVDIKSGAIRHKNEAFAQVTEASLFATDLTLMTTTLAAGAVAHSVQIAQDAIPFVGNAERKAANVQIAKAVKVFPMLKDLIDSQRNMLNRYFKQNANVETTDSVTDALAMGEIDFNDLETMEMSEEELEQYIAEEGEAS